jgi:allophanate hydrolase subunit 1
MSFDALGDRAIRFRRPERASARSIVRAVRAWHGVVDVVVGPRDVGVYFAAAPHVEPGWLADLAALPPDPEPVHDVELVAIYDGPDLATVAAAVEATIDDVIERHRRGSYRVEAMGFQPGFAYLVGLDDALALPRRGTPRPRVPAGSLAIAAAYTTVYPFDSPGGWHLIGRVIDAAMFGPAGPRLQLGDRVRFVTR